MARTVRTAPPSPPRIAPAPAAPSQRPEVRPGLRRRSLGLSLLGSLGLSACGFRLRGRLQLPFDSLAIRPTPGGALVQDLRRALADGVTLLPPDAPVHQAQAVLTVLGERREKLVAGVNASGQVREFQLRLRVRFRLDTGQGRELLPDSELLQQRDISYNESAALAKEVEEAMLYRDMQSDIVQQMLRRLAAVRPPA